LVGGRDVDEIAARLEGKFKDRSEPPLRKPAVSAILAYLDCKSMAEQMPQQLASLSGGERFAGAIRYYARRLEAMEEQGLNPRRFAFESTFGRDLEYYTGFVFQVEAEGPDGPLVVAGGGRYDNLLADMGAGQRIPAVGCAIHAERLKAVLA
jgi:ATP phosphoribosyltransferase regulatory subunit